MLSIPLQIGIGSIPLITAITAAVAFGGLYVLLKRGLSHGGNPIMAVIIVVLTSPSILGTSSLAFNGPSQLLEAISPFAFAIFFLGGFLGTAVGRIAMFEGVNRVGGSIASACVSLNPAFAAIVAFILLAELFTIVEAIGIIVILTGVVTLSSSRGGDKKGWQRYELIFPLVAAAAFGTAHVVRRVGLTVTAVGPLEGAVINEIAALVGVLGYAAVAGKVDFRSLSKKSTLYFVGAGILAAPGMYSEFLALVYEETAVVAAIVASQTLFAMILTYFFLDNLEKITARMVIAALFVVLGVGILGLIPH